MSAGSSVGQILAAAEEQERKYDWLGAGEYYKEARELVPVKDLMGLGEVEERYASALYRAAMQSETSNEFRERTSLASSGFDHARELYAKAGDQARSLRCAAITRLMGFWLAPHPTDKKNLLEQSWKLCKETLEKFKESGEAVELAKTYNQLFLTAVLGFELEWMYAVREKLVEELISYGEQTIKLLSAVQRGDELVRTLVIVGSVLASQGDFIPDLSEANNRRAIAYCSRATEISKEVALLSCLGHARFGIMAMTESYDEAQKIFGTAMELAAKSRDRFLMGSALDILSYIATAKASIMEDPDEMRETLEEALHLAIRAKHEFSIVSFTSSRYLFWVEAPHTDYYFQLGRNEVDLDKKRELFAKSKEEATGLLERAEDSGYPYAIMEAHHETSRTLAELSKLETSLAIKKKLLEEALEHRTAAIDLIERVSPFFSWNLGVGHNLLSDIKRELSELSTEPNTKTKLLQEAILAKEKGIKLCVRQAEIYSPPDPRLSFFLGKWQYEYADLMSRQHGPSNDREDLIKAGEAYVAAAQSFRKANVTSRVAECDWKAAQICQSLYDHIKSSENFDQASRNYALAAENNPRLKQFYQDYSAYMKAWSEIEKAKQSHGNEEYGLAKGHYQNAARLHESTKRWSFLAQNYSAWAKVEEAEDLSRREMSQDAILGFENAAVLFLESASSIRKELESLENRDERDAAKRLIKASEIRQEYCNARKIIEKAKILDKEASHSQSAQQYARALEILQKLSSLLESDQTRSEFGPLILLSKAWQTLAEAEAEASPALYEQASELFEEAKAISSNERSKVLALGHSRFCKALAAGTEFSDTGDTTQHALALRHLQSASKYYLKAGYEKASEQVEATELLFDAYLRMDEAKRETDQEKKVRLYAITEKLLQESADAYLKSEQPSREDFTLKLLERVRNDRRLAISVSQVFSSPITLSTTAFAVPMPSQEKAVGLERLEHAEVEASVSSNRNSVMTGEAVELDLDFANVGKGSAQLIKLDGIVPKGFEVRDKPLGFSVEDGSINMKGRRLDALKTESVRVILSSNVRGVFVIKPQIAYLDDEGRYNSREMKPLEVEVKDLGISGWLKGRKK